MAAIAAGPLPVLSLDPILCDDDVLAARAYGADAVVIPAGATDAMAKKARATRMVPLFLAKDEREARRAIEVGAKGLLIAADSADAVASIAATLPPTTRVLGQLLRDSDLRSLRALLGRVDAVVVEPLLAGTSEFESLQAEVDPA